MRVKFDRGITMFGHRLVKWTKVHWPCCGSDHGLLLAVPMLCERGFTCVGYIDDSGSRLPFTGEHNLNPHRAQRGLCPPQATGERPRISGQLCRERRSPVGYPTPKESSSAAVPIQALRWAMISRTQVATGSASIMLSIAARRFAS
jgi:hypothetical protein